MWSKAALIALCAVTVACGSSSPTPPAPSRQARCHHPRDDRARRRGDSAAHDGAFRKQRIVHVRHVGTVSWQLQRNAAGSDVDRVNHRGRRDHGADARPRRKTAVQLQGHGRFHGNRELDAHGHCRAACRVRVRDGVHERDDVPRPPAVALRRHDGRRPSASSDRLVISSSFASSAENPH
jgi:hypothetical protein